MLSRMTIDAKAASAAMERAGKAFARCPACGGPGIRFEGGRHWRCPDCGFDYFHNVAAAAGVIIESGGAILFLLRAKDPAKGRLALPGGFIDPGERAEDAAIRECREEVGWPPAAEAPGRAGSAEDWAARLRFVGSWPNLYEYRGVPYATCDLFFSLRLPPGARAWFRADPDEAAGLRWVPRGEMKTADLAFGSAVMALAAYLDTAPGS